MASESQTISTDSRPLAHFHPSVWGTRFLDYTPDQSNLAGEEQLVEELKEEVKRELKEASNDYMRQLQLVDAIQRLGVAYHFEDEIDQALKNLYEIFHDYCKDNHDLYTNALSFRLLRQHGYRVSCEVFDKFKDSKEDLEVPVNAEEVAGVLEFFEATHLRIHGDDVLDHGFVLSRNQLQSALPSLSCPLADQVHYALNQYSNRRGLPRLNARHYISIYHQFASHHETLLKLAKLDFNLLQSLHKTELSQICRWWEELDVPRKFGYARDRIVELYFWVSGVYFEPKYSFARKILVRFQGFMSIIDDTYDAYATFEELHLFTNAIEKWSFTCLDQLPDYMKVLYKKLLETFQEIEEELLVSEGASHRITYGMEAIKRLVRCYFAEAKWLNAKYTPKTEEYMHVAVPSCGYISLITVSFIGMGDVATKEAFDWVLSVPAPVKGASIICRLTDDIVGHEFDREREHVPSSIECYTEEHTVSKEEAVLEFKDQLEAAWKDVNEGFLGPTKIPVPLLSRILNYSRTIEVMYSKGDWYTHVGPEMQSFIMQLLVDPVPQ